MGHSDAANELEFKEHKKEVESTVGARSKANVIAKKFEEILHDPKTSADEKIEALKKADVRGALDHIFK